MPQCQRTEDVDAAAADVDATCAILVLAHPSTLQYNADAQHISTMDLALDIILQDKVPIYKCDASDAIHLPRYRLRDTQLDSHIQRTFMCPMESNFV